MPALSARALSRLNQQIANELHASHLYLAMAAHFESEDLPGSAAWMRAQAEEERAHAMKFYAHVNERGGRVVLEAIEKPPAKFAGHADVFAKALAHERAVTRQIYQLYEAAEEEGDYALQVFLNWFVTEQVEEEQQAQKIHERVKRVEKDPTGLMILDRELAGRTAAK